MEFVLRVAAPLPYVPPARQRVLALVERDGPLCAWCGAEVSVEWPARHPAAPVAAPVGGGDGVRLAHRFCVDPANRKFDVDAVTPVRRARLVFAVEVAGAPDAAQRWRRFESGSDPDRATVAHLRAMRRFGARVTFADVVAAVAGPLLHRRYLARMRRWASRPLPTGAPVASTRAAVCAPQGDRRAHLTTRRGDRRSSTRGHVRHRGTA
ncbi:hypothetical protein ACIGNX_31665 [Actinosynnema sp. NPDC053489]|uniref:hypothetical protein n=1 Tax=Actinosynnema sp. NPDC053489 TaxID=3363916 RepID=UPI0037CB7D5D